MTHERKIVVMAWVVVAWVVVAFVVAFVVEVDEVGEVGEVGEGVDMTGVGVVVWGVVV